jgi:hypothetical protein
MNNISVIGLPSAQTHDWLLNKHYAHRLPCISYAFGIYSDNILEGVCTFAKPMSWSLQIGICGKDESDKVLELNRLVINPIIKNQASYFIARCLKLLPHPAIIVSYADTAQNHHGYIYQASNFLYTGMSKPFKEYALKGNEQLHSASIGDLVGRSDKIGKGFSKYKLLEEKFGKENIYWGDRSLKHRYIYFLGNKKQKKELLAKLKYPILPYPKGDNTRYDASYQPKVQGILI